MLDTHKDEKLQEMEVDKKLNQPYVQCLGLIDVRMEGPKAPTNDKQDQILPAVDVFTMQKHLPKGQFPPNYGSRDTWNCIKVFYCTRCMIKMNGTETVLKHVKGIKHWRKIGKIFVNDQLFETFNPVLDPVAPKEGEEETEEEKAERLAGEPKLCANCDEEDKVNSFKYIF